MLKLPNKKGFTLIEVLCSLGIFSIIFICIISCQLSALKMKKSIKTMNDNVLIMETLKNNIIYSMTYAELDTLEKKKSFYIDNEKSFYVGKENLSLDKLKGGLINIFTVEKPIGQQYIELSFLQCEPKVYHLKVILYTQQINNQPQLQCDFYKGKHR